MRLWLMRNVKKIYGVFKDGVQWIVDLPDPYNTNAAWIEMGNFDRRKDAVDFVVNKIGIPRRFATCLISRIEIS